MTAAHEANAPVSATTLAQMTTMGVGGGAAHIERVANEAQIIEAIQAADAAGDELLVVGGGSNLVVSDEGFAGTVIHIVSSGIHNSERSVVVQAGHPWDDFVRHVVHRAWSGVEMLSGIPGSVGASPVQNIGAYGGDVSQSILTVRVWDRKYGCIRRLNAQELAFGYRESLLKKSFLHGALQYVVLSVEFALRTSEKSAPIRYEELARRLKTHIGDYKDVREIREHVLELRTAKGMLLDSDDRDTASAGSFFTNPIVSAQEASALPAELPRYPAAEGVKLSAAWLISHAGFARGFGGELTEGRASLSTKHVLAITNRGGARTADILQVARVVRDGVWRSFHIALEPEPFLVACSL